MQPVLAWLLAGLLLVVVELMTGTFYLLILGLAAAIGSLVAYLDQPFWMQALIAALAAFAGGARALSRHDLGRGSRWLRSHRTGRTALCRGYGRQPPQGVFDPHPPLASRQNRL